MECTSRNAKTVSDAKDGLSGLFKSKFPLTPELQNRSLESLYLNIYELLSGIQQEKAQTAINFTREMEDAENVLQAESSNKPIGFKEKAIFKKLIEAIRALRLNKS